MNRKVLIGITGSIAAYKACELIRLFKKNGDDVKVVSSEAGLLFVGEKTLESLSLNPVFSETFQKRDNTKHISLADWADIFIIAPITANTISKIATGIADNLLVSTACAYLGKKKPFFIAPAMNEGMLLNPFVQENIERLKKAGVKVIDPVRGTLACGYEGFGKMQEPCKIFEIVNPEKKGKVVVTAGGTREYIDPVRFITNASSGKTGVALADCAYGMGYDVVLISTFEISKPYKVITVNSAVDMENAVKEEFRNSTHLIMAAAVSDFKVENPKTHKISKKEIENNIYNVALNLNPDILKNISQIKTKSQKVIGFSLTTEDAIEVGKEKLQEKKCDYIVANNVNVLNGDDTEVWVIDTNENIVKIGPMPKIEAAGKILEIVL